MNGLTCASQDGSTPLSGPLTAPAPGDGAMSYTLDHADCIVAVGGAWDDFARVNQGDAVLSSKVVGRKLDQFIHDDVTRMFVRSLLMAARLLRKPISRPYRCDAPALKRFMEMTVTPDAVGGLEVTHRELRSEPMLHRVQLVAAPPGSEAVFTKRCSLCNRVQAKGVWSEVDAAVQAGRLTDNGAGLKVFYGVCPDCRALRHLPS
jgi:hypothetical protein